MNEILVTKLNEQYVTGYYRKSELSKEQKTLLHDMGFKRRIVPFIGYEYFTYDEPKARKVVRYGHDCYSITF